MEVLEKTASVCPACFQEGKIKKLDAEIVEDKGKVYISKTCDKHGSFRDIYFSDSKLYKSG